MINFEVGQGPEQGISNLNALLAALNFWQPSTVVAVGDVVKSHSVTAKSMLFAECTSAGTTGTSEPTGGANGDIINDGTAVWTIRDLRNPISKVSKAGDDMTGNLEVPSLTIAGKYASPLNFKNKIINGNFDIWQQGDSFSSSGYGLDKWVCGHTGTTKIASKQVFALGQTDVPNEPKFFLRHVVTSVAGADNNCRLMQYVDDVQTLSGKTATLSFWAKADSSRNIAIEFIQDFGTGGNPSAIVTGIGSQLIALTTNWKKYKVTVSLPSVSGKTIGNNNNKLSVNFWFDAGSNLASRTSSLGQQSGTFDIAQVQLEDSAIGTEFENRPLTLETLLCMAYYQKGEIHLSTVPAASYFGGTHYYTVPLHATPTLTYTDIVGNIGKVTTDTNGNNIAISSGAIASSAISLNIDAIFTSSPGNWVKLKFIADANIY